MLIEADRTVVVGNGLLVAVQRSAGLGPLEIQPGVFRVEAG